MKFSNAKRLLAIGLAAAMLLGTHVVAAVDPDKQNATRGEVVEMLMYAADNYNPDLKRTDIIHGYGGDDNLQEDREVSRVEALIMLARAFGSFPALKGHNERVAFQNGEFSDIPDWAKPEIAPVLASGIAMGTGDGIFSSYSPVTKGQMKLFIKRTFALFGSNEKDDFYAAVNRDKLNSIVILPAHTSAGTLTDLELQASTHVNEIISQTVQNGGSDSSIGKKMADFYACVLDIEGRANTGFSPIEKILSSVREAQNITELSEAQSVIQNSLCVSPFAAFGITVDLSNSTRYIPTFGVLTPSMPKSFYTDATETQKNAYMNYMTALLNAVGESDAERKMNDFYEFEKTLSTKALSPEESSDVDKVYNLFTLSEISELFPNIDIKRVLKDSGLVEENAIVVENPEIVKEFSRLYTDENLETLKSAALLSILSVYGQTLSDDIVKADDAFNEEYLGVKGAYSNEARAVTLISNIMSDYIGEIYAEQFFSEEAKQNVLKMVNDIREVYKERIRSLDWMTYSTKEKAIRKLDKMSIKIGYPDQFGSYLDYVDIRSPEKGGSYFKTVVSIAQISKLAASQIQGETVNKQSWRMKPYSVNACYDVTANDITFPTAILQPPMYDENASYEENLGAIGYVIAHEITHAFDNNGAKFDEDGNAYDWWTEKDYAEFEKRCEKMVQFYNGCEGIPGIPMNGRLTLSENVADQGAVQCITEIVSRLPNPDYQKLYRSMANAWASTKTREYAQYAASVDVHAEDKLRVNRVVVNCEEFYEAFGITENDGMWVAPEDRVIIW